MKRSPMYHDTNGKYRIVSVPNGMWQYQHLVGDCDREHDGWIPLSRVTDFATAQRQLLNWTPA
jgi:hypothetical protein